MTVAECESEVRSVTMSPRLNGVVCYLYRNLHRASRGSGRGQWLVVRGQGSVGERAGERGRAPLRRRGAQRIDHIAVVLDRPMLVSSRPEPDGRNQGRDPINTGAGRKGIRAGTQ